MSWVEWWKEKKGGREKLTDLIGHVETSIMANQFKSFQWILNTWIYIYEDKSNIRMGGAIKFCCVILLNKERLLDVKKRFKFFFFFIVPRNNEEWFFICAFSWTIYSIYFRFASFIQISLGFFLSAVHYKNRYFETEVVGMKSKLICNCHKKLHSWFKFIVILLAM